MSFCFAVVVCFVVVAACVVVDVVVVGIGFVVGVVGTDVVVVVRVVAGTQDGRLCGMAGSHKDLPHQG